MGLDLYAGPMTRYYAGLWKTIIQQEGEAQGVPVRIVRASGNDGDAPAPDEAHETVVDWQRALREATGNAELDWPESTSLPYFTDKPDWDGYWALVVLAAADQSPEIPAPEEIAPDLVGTGRGGDPAKHRLIRRADEIYLRSGRPGLLGRLLGRAPASVERRYPHILSKLELWLPADFSDPFWTADPAGKLRGFGSSHRLLRELESLNARTLRADDATLDAYSREGPSTDDFSLGRQARFGLAVFVQGARYAVENRVPLLLDY